MCDSTSLAAGPLDDVRGGDALTHDGDVDEPVPVEQAGAAQQQVDRCAQRREYREQTMRHTTTNPRPPKRPMD
jgi:hypothetical protein